MATEIEEAPKPSSSSPVSKENTSSLLPLPPFTLSSYIGLSFAIFAGLVPPSLESRNRELCLKLSEAENELKQMKSRRKEDFKANARVVEIFASHRNGWQQEEKRLLQQIQDLKVRIEELEKSDAELRACIRKLEREVDEREEMINFMSWRDWEGPTASFDGVQDEEEYGMDSSKWRFHQEEEEDDDDDHQGGFMHDNQLKFRFGLNQARDFVPNVSPQTPTNWQDIRCDSQHSSYHPNHFAPRRESPWKLDGESTGVPTKLKLLEQELINLDKIDSDQLSNIPSLLRKQAKRYQALSRNIHDLCTKMQVNGSSEPAFSSEFQTRCQTEFLIEAYRLQQRAVKTGQKLTALQTETSKSNFSNGIESHIKFSTRSSLNSIRNNFRDIQRNLEVWLARIMGDLEGILARDGTSHVREHYLSRYPFVQ